MSCEVTKTVLRAEIPALKGKSISEAYAFFRQHVGEPDEIYRDDGVVDYFFYKSENHRIVPVKGLRSKTGDENRWGIEAVLSYENGYGKKFGKPVHSLQELTTIGKEFVERFGAREAGVKLFSYTYYNGVDEPMAFE